MNTIQKEYYRVLAQTNALALATAVDNRPNVRIVNFVYAPDRPGILYFMSDRENKKVLEFQQNSNAAFPVDGVAHVRARQALVQKSRFTIDDLKDLFIAKVPGYDQTLEAIGGTLDVFEIQVKKAVIVTGFGEPAALSF
ncbi:pyridoxamine 5'-phosphate oxidase family protein|uniref:Pyridoxamine 5'-phosphate oxidase n=1 Tax=Dendrosporobacter quercicolus TaxID=146817 RepID=A0A1G9UVT8_9FIRM|nr:pyridoxamine 5'-phosphate oxidase family protein [Dendrosporobacter quercicolus]NSL48013.1 pyridoxamine 5'-phosphate oxidase family protein [Dendrosporobacter quercicolus DSM 1736]SDM63917.1 Pyridoxamine 5'-phosphate oxidase [Dendrosporobacter quercicolus]